MTVVEHGSTLTIVERGDPFDDPEYVGELRSIRRIWLGDMRGAEWLHEEAERRLGQTTGMFEVRSERTSVHVGASAEIATVILELLGAGIAGKIVSDLIDYAKEHVRKEAENVGRSDSSPPDFATWGEGFEPPLPEAIKAELADVAKIPAERLELVEELKSARFVHSAMYRDSTTGFEYVIEIGRQEATMRRVGPEG